MKGEGQTKEGLDKTGQVVCPSCGVGIKNLYESKTGKGDGGQCECTGKNKPPILTTVETELLQAISDYYELPLGVFFMTTENFKKGCGKQTRMKEVEYILEAYDEIENIIYDVKAQREFKKKPEDSNG